MSAVTALAVAVSLGACGGTPASQQAEPQPAEEQATTRVVTDSLGREVEIPAEVERIAASGPVAQQVLLTVAPEKMVGLSGELTDEQLAYLGEDLADLPVFGQIYGGKGDFNKEAVAAADPQLIIDVGEAKESLAEELDTLQDQIGIPCVHIDSTDLHSYADLYDQLADILDLREGRRARGLLPQMPWRRSRPSWRRCRRASARARRTCSATPAPTRWRAAASSRASSTCAPTTSWWWTTRRPAARATRSASSRLRSGTPSSSSSWATRSMTPWATSLPGPSSPPSNLETTSARRANRTTGSPCRPRSTRSIGLQWYARLCYPSYFDDDLRDVVGEYYQLFYAHDLTDEEYDALMRGAVRG